MSLFVQLARRARQIPCITPTAKRHLGSVSAIDSSIFRTLFGTDEIRKVGCSISLI